jgi:hypothetical protein
VRGAISDDRPYRDIYRVELIEFAGGIFAEMDLIAPIRCK